MVAGLTATMPRSSLAEVQEKRLILLDFLLQLQETVQQTFRRGWAPGDVNVDGNNAVATADDSVGVVIVAATVGATSHRNYPAGLGHLVVYFPECGCHLVRQRAGDNHDIRLTGGSTEHNAKTLHIVSGSGGMHHFHGAAGEAESHRPQRAFARPIGDLIEAGHDKLHVVGGAFQKPVELGPRGRSDVTLLNRGRACAHHNTGTLCRGQRSLSEMCQCQGAMAGTKCRREARVAKRVRPKVLTQRAGGARERVALAERAHGTREHGYNKTAKSTNRKAPVNGLWTVSKRIKYQIQSRSDCDTLPFFAPTSQSRQAHCLPQRHGCVGTLHENTATAPPHRSAVSTKR